MKRNYLITLIVLAALGAGAFGAYQFGMSRGMKLAAPPSASTVPGATAAKAGDIDPATGRKILYWHDPMAPQQKFDKPGKSPYMDMMLVPVYADGGDDSSAVRISSRVAQNLGIRIAEVTQGTLTKKIAAVGAITFDERAVAVVQARVGGYIERLFVRAPLDPVAQGQPLAEIFAPEWIAAQEEYLAMRKSPQAGDALKLAARQRLALLGMPESEIAAIEADGKTRPRITLTAPIGGVIGELGAREGMTVMPGAMLFRINGLGTVWVNAEVPETQAAWLKPGGAVEATVAAYAGETFKGRIAALLPEVNQTTRTLKARIELANPGARLKPGMFAAVDFAPQARQEVLMVPTEAVIQTGQRSVVVIAETAQDGKQQFKPVDVEVGSEEGGMSEIRKGLERGMKVVASGQFLIDSESSLKTTGTRMSNAPAPGATHSGKGKVEAINKDAVLLSHGAIPSAHMGAMTMEYKFAPGFAAPGVRAGDSVQFDFRTSSQGEFEITAIRPNGGAPAKGGAQK
jgi:Cu(I)/Ag(I) efflux system membrane fusion protein